jgi:hypothetical protein
LETISVHAASPLESNNPNLVSEGHTSTDLGTCGSSKVPDRVIFRRHVRPCWRWLYAPAPPAEVAPPAQVPSLAGHPASGTHPGHRPRPLGDPPDQGCHRQQSLPRSLQAVQIKRRCTDRKTAVKMVDAVTSPTAEQATPAQITQLVAITGRSRPCTTSAPSPSQRTPPRCGPATRPAHGYLAQPRHRSPPDGRSGEHRGQPPP